MALLNLGLVFFDLSYVYSRDVYLQIFPYVAEVYDPIKGIQPHKETQNYLNKVTELEGLLLQDSLQSPEVESSLQELRRLSQRMIEENPFDSANKSGIFESLKNLMRERTGEVAARDAFATFWSQPYLSRAGLRGELDFFNDRIRPRIASNYYRHVTRYGHYLDRFWIIDCPFVLLFGLDFLGRTFYASRHRPNLSSPKAMLRRWYDIFLLLPFWRWLRIIPVTVRLYRADLLNLEPVREQINYDFAVNFAEDITEMVGVQVIDQMQDSIRRGDAARWLFHPESRRPYVQVNQENEVTAIAARVAGVTIYDVFPQVQPQFEALVRHNLEKILSQFPICQQLQNVPGLSHLPSQVAGNLANNLSQAAYSSLTGALEDPVGEELAQNMVANFRDTLEVELQKKRNVQEIESLLVDMLEEIKINYVKGLTEKGTETLWEKANLLRKSVVPQTKPTLPAGRFI